MSEKEPSQFIRYSYGISFLQAFTKSVGVMLVLSLLVFLGGLIDLAGTSVLVMSVILIVFMGLNLLGYVELSMSVPQQGGSKLRTRQLVSLPDRVGIDFIRNQCCWNSDPGICPPRRRSGFFPV